MSPDPYRANIHLATTRMKKTFLLAALFLLLGAGAWYVIAIKNKKTGSAVSWDMDFTVKDPGEIGKVFIADRLGNTASLVRKDDHWVYNDTWRARQSAVNSLLETLSQMKVQYIPPEAAEEGIVKVMATQGIKVEVYDRHGDKMKIFYVGGVTIDERGTYMIMEGSENPYVVHIPGFIGQLRVRFFLGDDNWRDRSVFTEKVEEIQSVSVDYPQQRSMSFKIEKGGEQGYTVSPFYSTTPLIRKPQRTGIPEAYLAQFESLVAEAHETANSRRDSILSLVPFAVVNLKKTDGSEKKVRFWPVTVERNPDTGAEYVDRYFTDVNQGEAFMLTQDRVFGKLFRGYPFFFEVVNTEGIKN
jgi:hypothetical protein